MCHRFQSKLLAYRRAICGTRRADTLGNSSAASPGSSQWWRNSKGERPAHSHEHYEETIAAYFAGRCDALPSYLLFSAPRRCSLGAFFPSILSLSLARPALQLTVGKMEMPVKSLLLRQVSPGANAVGCRKAVSTTRILSFQVVYKIRPTFASLPPKTAWLPGTLRSLIGTALNSSA